MHTPMKPKMSLMVGTKMTRALVPPSRRMVMMVWRIQLNSLDLDRCWLMEVRIYREREKRRGYPTWPTAFHQHWLMFSDPRHLQGRAPPGRWGWRRSAQPDARSAGWCRTWRIWSRCAEARAPRALCGQTRLERKHCTRGNSSAVVPHCVCW